MQLQSGRLLASGNGPWGHCLQQDFWCHINEHDCICSHFPAYFHAEHACFENVFTPTHACWQLPPDRERQVSAELTLEGASGPGAPCQDASSLCPQAWLPRAVRFVLVWWQPARTLPKDVLDRSPLNGTELHCLRHFTGMVTRHSLLGSSPVGHMSRVRQDESLRACLCIHHSFTKLAWAASGCASHLYSPPHPDQMPAWVPFMEPWPQQFRDCVCAPLPGRPSF